MVIPLLRRNALRLHERHYLSLRLVNKMLVCALSHLTVHVVHESTSKDDDLVLGYTESVSTAPLRPVHVEVFVPYKRLILSVRHCIFEIGA